MNGIDWSPVWISMKVAGITMLITFFLGLGAAWFVCRRKKEISKAVWDGIFTMPLVLPPTVVGFVLLYLFGGNGPAGKFFLQFFGVKIAFSQTAAVLAAVVISFPLMYRSARGAIEQVEPNLLRAGRTLGMTEWQIFYTIHIPNALPGIISGGILAFARALGEFGATAMIAGNIPGKTRTLPLAVYSETAAGNMEMAGRYAVVILVICFGIVIGMNLYLAAKKKRTGHS